MRALFSCSKSHHQLAVDLAAVFEVNARNALADGAGQLIRNGSGKLRERLDRVIRAEDLDLVPYADIGQLAEVDHAHIHADPAALGCGGRRRS